MLKMKYDDLSVKPTYFFYTQPKNLFRSYQERLKLLLQAKGFYYKAINSSKNQANLDGLNKKMNLESSEIYILELGEKIKQTLNTYSSW